MIIIYLYQPIIIIYLYQPIIIIYFYHRHCLLLNYHCHYQNHHHRSLCHRLYYYHYHHRRHHRHHHHRQKFIREGCLQKLSGNGYHQRLFILLNDRLIYANRTPMSSNSSKFYVCGSVPLYCMQQQQLKENLAINNAFIIKIQLQQQQQQRQKHQQQQHKFIEVAASSSLEKTKWIEDLNRAITNAKYVHRQSKNSAATAATTTTTTATTITTTTTTTNTTTWSSSQLSSSPHHANTLMYVCWHRNTSVSMFERSLSMKNFLSGFLLRKFKNSSGWQRLWVAFSNFCLFFYKSYTDEFPLASLPLLGYSIKPVDQSEGLMKDHVFKLTFKNHAYYFRAENQYTYSRWLEVISSTIESSHHFRLFSRAESFPHSS
ncbi:hypothetical protein HELRODRAFT_112974 [Helobdella robusta]|uniref:PH domain-containing protein n=1 Tax=Helobdella robusta TaxID=6412 RepID=T1EFN9_HELRO|nr:hypothetical protein HELRODRAFT_112974 [Helobdella robusta]ESO00829.1 hypothetical protein HELRODRAFT_112974 [Helobdella robusta]